VILHPLVQDIRADLALDKLEGAGTYHLLPIQFLAASIPAGFALHHQVSVRRDVLDKLRSGLLEVKADGVIINDLYPLLDFLRRLRSGVILANPHESTPETAVSLYRLRLRNQEDCVAYVVAREWSPVVVELDAFPQRNRPVFAIGRHLPLLC